MPRSIVERLALVTAVAVDSARRATEACSQLCMGKPRRSRSATKTRHLHGGRGPSCWKSARTRVDFSGSKPGRAQAFDRTQVGTRAGFWLSTPSPAEPVRNDSSIKRKEETGGSAGLHRVWSRSGRPADLHNHRFRATLALSFIAMPPLDDLAMAEIDLHFQVRRADPFDDRDGFVLLG